MEFGDLVRKYLISRGDCDPFHGQNHFEIHILDPEICLFENTCSLNSRLHPLDSDSLLSWLIKAIQINPLLTNLLLKLLQLLKDDSI